ncbi:MAG: hypothetical protein KGS72_05130 [Cyanobacteria bacterium REEB67]|nr:hypothetical protein [Cyanobacteria bacterium REEB67]
MSKTLAVLAALALVACAIACAVFYFLPDPSVTNVRFNESTSRVTVHTPDASRPESFIVSTSRPDGDSVDDVDMRDGRSKQYLYDDKHVLRHASVFYKGLMPGAHGPLQYEKFLDADGHLRHEEHWRKDGSLEMVGQLIDQIYVRRAFYPGTSHNPADLGVATQTTFDLKWHPLTQVDFRPDRTVSAQHQWKDSEETTLHFAGDGKTAIFVETKKDFDYYQGFYYEDGSGLRVDETNGPSGTIYQLFNRDHKMTRRLVFTNTMIDQFTIMDGEGRPEWVQTWVEDWSREPVSGSERPRALIRLEHLRPDGKLDKRYTLDRTGAITAVTVMDSTDITGLGARRDYTVGASGFATDVSTYDEHNYVKSKVDLTPADDVRFELPAFARERSTANLPPVKDGYKLYGDPPQQGPY